MIDLPDWMAILIVGLSLAIGLALVNRRGEK